MDRQWRRVGLLGLGLATALAASAGAVGEFEGVWEVTSIQIAAPGSEWAAKSRLPTRVEIRPADGRLQAVVTDQTGIPIHCTAVREISDGHELQLVGCAPSPKGKEAAAPVHRVQLRGTRLQATLATDRVIYTWTAARVP